MRSIGNILPNDINLGPMVFVKMGKKGVNLGTVDDEDLCYTDRKSVV